MVDTLGVTAAELWSCFSGERVFPAERKRKSIFIFQTLKSITMAYGRKKRFKKNRKKAKSQSTYRMSRGGRRL